MHPLRLAGLAAAVFGMAASPFSQTLSPEMPERDGELFAGAVTLAALHDPARRTYRLYPDAPLAAEVRVRPDFRVGIIDSGILQEHPQISGLVVAARDWTGEGIEDRQGHGTMVALGVLYGRGLAEERKSLPGAAANAVPGLVIAKIAATGKPLKLRDVVDAIHWAAGQKVQLINLSLGFRGDPKDFSALRKAIDAHPDILFFAAAGNYGPRIPVFPAAFRAPNLMAVAEASPESGKGDVLAPTTYEPIDPELYAARRHQDRTFQDAMLAAREKRFPEAKRQLQAIAESADHPWAAEAWIQLGLVAVAEKDPETALRHFAASQKINPATAALLETIGQVHFNRGNFAASEENLRASVALEATNPAVRYLLGLALLRQRKYRSALEQFEATFRLDPHHPDLRPILNDLRAAHARGQLPVD